MTIQFKTPVLDWSTNFTLQHFSVTTVFVKDLQDHKLYCLVLKKTRSIATYSLGKSTGYHFLSYVYVHVV